MLPKFKNYQEKSQFAKRIFDLLTSDERVSSMLGADKTDWPDKLVNNELENNRSGYHDEEYNSADKLNSFICAGAGLMKDLRTAMQPLNNPGWIDRALQDIDKIFVSYGMTGAPESQKPLNLVQDYLNTFGKSQVGNPAMNFIMGFAQAFENASLNIQAELPELTDDAEVRKELEALDGEVQKGQQLFTELCEKNNLSFNQNFDRTLKVAKSELQSNREKFQKATAAAAKYSKQLDGVDAEKLMQEYQQASDAFDQAWEKYDVAHNETIRTQKVIDSLNERAKKINDQREKNKQSLAEYTQKNEQAKLQYSSNETEIAKVQDGFENLRKENPKIEDAVNLYNRADNAIAALKDTAKRLTEAFQNYDKSDKFTNLLWNVNNGAVRTVDLDPKDRQLIDCYFDAKKQLLDTMYPKYSDERKRLEGSLNLKEYPTHSDNAALELLSPEGALTKAIEEMENTKDGLQYVPHLEEGLKLKEQYRKLQSEQNSLENQMADNQLKIDIIKDNETNLTEREENLESSCRSSCKDFDIKPEEFQPKDGKPMSFKEYMDRAEKYLAGKKEVEKQLDEALNPLRKAKNEKEKSVKTIKISAENLKKLEEAKKKIDRYEKKVQIYGELKTIKDQTISKMEEKNALLKYYKEGELLKQDTAKRAPFIEAAESLSQRIPKVAGEKNSEHYTKMQEKLEKFTTIMRNGRCSAKERKDALEALGKAAKDYMAEKDKQWRPFATEKRRSRLQAAKDIAAFCEATKDSLDKLPSVKAELAQQIGSVNVKADPLELAKNEFSKTMNTKQSERNAREQENAKKQKQAEKVNTTTAPTALGGKGK